MTQSDKDLLLKDLCARLPYGVKIAMPGLWDNKITIEPLNEIFKGDDDLFRVNGNGHCIEYIKPYLFPLSSMTNELWDKEFMGCGITEFTRDSFKYGCETLEFNNDNPHLSSMVRFINQLIKNHFDIYGLIPLGLANDATGLNIY